MKFDEKDLKEKGFIFKNGTWQKPRSTPVDKLETRKHTKQTRALDKGGKKKQGSSRSRSKGNRRKRPPEIIITMTAHLPRYFDSDNLDIALKPVRDALAKWIGVDDGDYIIMWEHDQTLTRGEPGICVVVRRV